MKTKILVMISLCLIYLNSNAQTDTSQIETEVGKSCPDFVLHNIQYYPKKQANLSDFKGKWLLLEFWDKSCGACIASFPRMNAIQKEFSKQLQVILVGLQDKEKEIEPLYARFRKKENLVMPCAFDSLLVNRFQFSGYPYSVLIDDKGVVQHIGAIDTSIVRGYLTGHVPIQITKSSFIPFDVKKPFLINNNGGKDSDFISRSVLSKWTPGINGVEKPYVVNIDTSSTRNGRFQVLSMPIEGLYKDAFFGKDYWDYADTTLYGKVYGRPILETRDSLLFKYSFITGKNIYCYAIQMPPEVFTVSRLKENMQRDLQNFFGFETSVETRRMPYWKLTATKEAKGKLKAKGGPTSTEGNFRMGFRAKNMPFKDFLAFIQYANTNEIFLDETGITENIDIDMNCKDCVMTNIKDVKKALQANGLDLVPAEKEMKVLVIRDSKPN